MLLDNMFSINGRERETTEDVADRLFHEANLQTVTGGDAFVSTMLEWS